MAKAGIIYVGTSQGLVIYSDPGGSGRWRRVGVSLEGQPIEQIRATDALNLTVLSASVVLQTSDGGQHWSTSSDHTLLTMRPDAQPYVATATGPIRWSVQYAPIPNATALALLVGDPELLIAAFDAGRILARSEDGGSTWQPGEVVGGLMGQIQTIEPSRYHMDIAWAGSDCGQLLRSHDRGQRWHAIAREPVPILCLAVVRLA
jgi:photosystem II stability/assembly factor-like uncharacterized protein